MFESEASLEAALALNMRLEVEGRHLRVDRAAPKSVKGGVQFDWRRSLFVGNLPHDVQVRRAGRGGGRQPWPAVCFGYPRQLLPTLPPG